MALDDELSSSSSDSDHDVSDTEDLELIALAPPLIPLAADLSILKTSQLDHQMFFDKYKSLKIKYEELLASSSLKIKRSKGVGRVTLAGESTEISRAGGRFSVVGEPWVDRLVFAIPFPGNVDPLDPARYNNSTTENSALTAELYKSLLKHPQKALANDNQRDTFRDIFLKKLGQERANSAHAARTHEARILKLNHWPSSLKSPVIDNTRFLPHTDAVSVQTSKSHVPFPPTPADDEPPIEHAEHASFFHSVQTGAVLLRFIHNGLIVELSRELHVLAVTASGSLYRLVIPIQSPQQLWSTPMVNNWCREYHLKNVQDSFQVLVHVHDAHSLVLALTNGSLIRLDAETIGDKVTAARPSYRKCLGSSSASTFAHLDATTVLSCSTADLAIYPAVDPFRTIKSRMPGPRITAVAFNS
ncbi:hypothetical protein EDB85DRAFT_2207350 [Lactarius pseudohatsudake]|nr:hypothetical protein EDB85DRAFT_2207350 [Lactarius pseudohatsudake]